jgi:type IV pilus assembly protein PilQ
LRQLIFAFFILILNCNGLYAKENTLSGMKIQPMPNNRLRVDFQFTDNILQKPASFITQKPARLVIDFVNSISQLDKDDQSKMLQLGSVQKYQVISVGTRVRVMFDLTSAITYSGSISGRSFSVLINGTGNELIPRATHMEVTHQPVNARYRIEHIDFKGTDKQGGRLFIDLSGPGVPVDISQKGDKVIARLMSTSIPEHLMKRFDVTDFHSPTETITARQKGKNAIITLTNKGDYGHFIYQVNKQLIIDVFPLSAEEIQQSKLKKKVFMGKRISLNFQNIQIRAVLQLLADFTGVNIVVSDKVNGNITLRLNDVPWDQALDIILTTQGLDKREVGNVVLIDTSADFTQRENTALKELEAAKKLAPIRSDLVQINYAKASEIATMLKDKNNSLLSERGVLSVDVRTNTIWLQDTGERIQEIRDLVEKLDIPVKQVSIEARIVNMRKDCELELGVRWGISKPTHLSGTLEGANRLANGDAPAAVPIAERLNLDLLAAPIAGHPPASVGIALAKLGSGVLLDLELSALENEERAEIIASPRLMTTDQKPAMIQSGEEIPYQEATSSGATAVAFKKAVLSLKVTPQITPDGKLLMELQINQDADSGRDVQGVPIITTKAIDTNVLVNNGQTIVLGGIYQQSKSNTVTRIPFLGTLPVVGHLFRSDDIKSKNEELLIFITPRIITNNLSITAIEGNRPRVPPCAVLDNCGKPIKRPINMVK